MKRLLFILFMGCLSYVCLAQNNPLCGEWVGTYSMNIPDDNEDGYRPVGMKMHVRIDNYDGSYVVRVKTISLDDGKTTYRPDAKVTSSGDKRVSWTHFLDDDYDWSSTDRMNGSRVKHAIYILHCNATFKGGTVEYHEEYETIYYGTNENVIDARKWGAANRVLYNANDNW